MKLINHRLWGFVCLLLLAGLRLDAQVSEVAALRVALAQNRAVRDSLDQAQTALQLAVGRLSQRVDSLKQGHFGGVAKGDLEAALQRSVHLVMLLEQTSARHDRIAAETEALQNRLRAAYDRDMARLMAQLNPADTAQVSRFRRLQAARASLPSPNTPLPIRIPDIVVRPEDGLETVRQKAELMSDVAHRVVQEIAMADARLAQLQEEQRLRNRVRQFAQELSVFDEGVSVGRSVAVGQTASSEAGDVKDASEELGIAPPNAGAEDARSPDRGDLLAPDLPAAVGEIGAGREVSLEALDLAMPAPGESTLAFEIRQLKARRAALIEQEAKVRARAERLRHLLEDMRSPKP